MGNLIMQGDYPYTFIGTNGQCYKKSGDYYKNKNAVSHLIHYVLRGEGYEARRSDLKRHAVFGVICGNPDWIVQQMLFVQKYYGIDEKKGRRMFHFIGTFDDNERMVIQNDYNLVFEIAKEMGRLFFERGYQTVVAVHDEMEKRVHIHIVGSTLNYYTGNKLHISKDDMRYLQEKYNTITTEYLSCYSSNTSPVPLVYFDQQGCKISVGDTYITISGYTKKYYGVYGKGGFGVYDNYDWLKRVIDEGYLYSAHQRSFDQAYKAFAWARDSYNELQECGEIDDLADPVDWGIALMKMNWIYYRKNINTINRAHYL